VEHQEVEVELVDEEQESEVTQLRSALQAALNQVEELQGAEEYLMHELWKAHRMLKQVRAPARCTCFAHTLCVARHAVWAQPSARYT
jgi:hypothetical protein